MRTKMIQRLPSLSAAMLALWVAAAAAATIETNAETKAAPAAATAAAKPRFSIHLYTRSALVEGGVNDTAQGPSFTVTRRDGVGQKEKIGWRVVPMPPNPVSAEDFECDELPSGELVFQPNEVETEKIYFGSLLPEGILFYFLNLLVRDNYFGLKKDGIKEGDEYFTVQLYDLDTDKDIPADFSRASMISVYDTYGFTKVNDNFYRLVIESN